MDIQVGIVTSGAPPASKEAVTVVHRCANHRCRRPVVFKRGDMVTQSKSIGVTRRDGALVLIGKCPDCGDRYEIFESALAKAFSG